MVLLMFRDGSFQEVPYCTDVVHKGGNLICLNSRGIPLVSVPDNRLLYYTLNDACINTIRIMNIRGPGTPDPEAQVPQAESVLERLWRVRQRRQQRGQAKPPR